MDSQNSQDSFEPSSQLDQVQLNFEFDFLNFFDSDNLPLRLKLMKEQINFHIKNAEINSQEQCFCIDELNFNLCSCVFQAKIFPCLVYSVLKTILGKMEGIIVETILTPIPVST